MKIFSEHRDLDPNRDHSERELDHASRERVQFYVERHACITGHVFEQTLDKSGERGVSSSEAAGLAHQLLPGEIS